MKFYIENQGVYYDITPIRYTSTLTNPLQTDTATNSGGYTTITVTDANLDPDGNTFVDGDYVTLYGSAGNITVGEADAGGRQRTARLADLPLAVLRKFSRAIGPDVSGWLTLEGSVARRKHRGGTAPRQVLRAVALGRKRLARA